MDQKFISIIPARSGSKGIKKKNLILLGGKPLIQWSMEASLNSGYIAQTIVSSDSKEIINFTENFNVLLHNRDPFLAQDDTETYQVIHNVFETYADLFSKFKYFILLQPTSPFRSYFHINEACRRFLDSESDTLVSAKEVQNSVLKTLFFDKTNKVSEIRDGFSSMPRQSLPKAMIPNGAIYISKIDYFRSNTSFISNKTLVYIMDETPSIDIDSYEDLEFAEKQLSLKEDIN